MTRRGIAPRGAGGLLALGGLAMGWSVSEPAPALDITGYSAPVNDRFTGVFPSAPVPNTAEGFIGLPYDWSGVAWSTTTYAASSYKGFAMLSPVHFLTAQHYENGSLLTAAVELRTKAGTLVSQTNTGVDNLGYGLVLTSVNVTAPDLALGTLAAPIAAPTAVARYPVLDLLTTSTSTTYSVYNGRSLLAYGRGATTNGSPRVGATTVNLAAAFNSDPTQTAIRTLYAGAGTVQLVEGDSGSPLFHGWTNPNGGAELAVLGLNSGNDVPNYNYMSLLAVAGAMTNTNAVMNPDGYALRVAGNPSNTWVGSSSQSIGNRTAWGLSAPATAPSDKYVLFDAATAGGGRSVVVDAASNQRGMSFKSTAAVGDGFTFSGASTFTIGRGGIVNYDNARQTISAPIALGSSQYWDVGSGGVTAGAINTAGFLLEVAGEGTAIVGGAVSGGGGVALSGTRLELTGTSSYTGGTWAHAGTLVVNGSIAASSGVTVAAAGRLAGSGVVAAIAGAGSVDPGGSAGILTSPSVTPAAGLDFTFEFGQVGSPTWGNAGASGNDVLRLQSGTAPFASALTADNTINVYFNVASLAANDTFRGGFFTDRDISFMTAIGGATFTYFVAAAGGSVTYGGVAYNPYTGPYTFDWSTVTETAAFSGGSELGYVGQVYVVPEPTTWLLVVGAAVGLTLARGRSVVR
ncbi:MAG: hypothetical protein FJ284_08835 [Planctomycetes bacterium]|nr:hypothetical protein [Planctomycetota bacterium]